MKSKLMIVLVLLAVFIPAIVGKASPTKKVVTNKIVTSTSTNVCVATNVTKVIAMPKLYVESKDLIYGVMKKENSRSDPNAVGDKHLANKAYGLLQIRAPYLKDVNRIAGQKVIRQVWGKNTLTMQDMKDKTKAEWAFHLYLSYYGEKYKQKTGNVPTAAVYARIHNGGPNGWKDKSTLKYAKAVIKYMEVYRTAIKSA